MVDSGSPTALLRNLPMLHDLADKAPEDLTDEWQTFLGALEGLDRALNDAGVEPADFQGGQPPTGLSAAHRKPIVDAASQIRPTTSSRRPPASSSRPATSARSTSALRRRPRGPRSMAWSRPALPSPALQPPSAWLDCPCPDRQRLR